MDAGGFDFLVETRSQAGWAQSADDLSVFNPSLFKNINISHGDHITFHAGNFGDVYNFTRAVPHTFLVDDQVNSRGDLLANGSDPPGRHPPPPPPFFSGGGGAAGAG